MVVSTENLKSSEAQALEYVLIIHEVVHYPAWKKVFDTAAIMRKNAGERSYQVLRYKEDANKIVPFSAWSSHANAKRFFQSPELKKIRQQAGVRSPDFIYLDHSKPVSSESMRAEP